MTTEDLAKFGQNRIEILKDCDALIFTDGSAKEGRFYGEAGAYVLWRSGQTKHLTSATGKITSSFESEVQALKLAVLTMQKECQRECSVGILSDSQSALTALKNGRMGSKNRTIEEIWENLNRLTSRRVKIRFV